MPDAAQAGSIATPVGGLACGALRPAVLMVYDTASMNVPISTIGVDNAAKRSILRGKKRAKNIMGELPDVLDRGRRERKTEEVDDRLRRRCDDLVYSALRGRIPRRRPRRAVLDREPRASESNRGVCGFATAWLTNTVYTAYIVRGRTGGETRREAGNPEGGSEDGVNRRSSNRSEPAEVPLTCLTNKDRRGRDDLRRSLSRLHRS